MDTVHGGSALGLDLSRAWGEAPSLGGIRALQFTTGSLYLAGCLIVLAIATLEGDLARGPMAVIAVGAAFISIATLRWGNRIPRQHYHWLVGLGSVLVSIEVLLAGGGVASMAISTIYAFAVIDAIFMFPLREAAAQVAFIYVVGSLSMIRVGLPLGSLIVLGGVGGVLCVVVAWLTRIAEAAEVDALTGLLNRRGLDRRMDKELAHLRRSDSLRVPLSLVVLDIDEFKRINDSGGHIRGDRSLIACADAWAGALPPAAVLGRYGGDEFAVLLPGYSLGQAGDIADELRALTPPGIRASAGVAAGRPDDSVSILLGRADAALYEAKVAGRDRTVVHGDPARRGREIERAVSRNELLLHFQPVVRLSSDEVVAYEALVRWLHPTRGMVMPDEFIPDAERTGAIHSLGAWVREEAARIVMTTAGPRIPVTVNVSIHELRAEGFVAEVAELLERWAMSPDLLILEVTESVFDDQDPRVLETVDGFRKIGVTIAMDDFGAGYSSLRRLTELPIDLIKVDGTLLQAIQPDSYEAPILEAVITMARSLGVDVIAERVETAHQAAVLRRLGYDLVQGYLFGRPGPR